MKRKSFFYNNFLRQRVCRSGTRRWRHHFNHATTKETTMMTAADPVRLAGSPLSRSCHVCAFFHSKEEQYRVLMPFIKEGIERGDRAFHLVDPKHRHEHLRRLEQEGIDVADAEAKGQLEVARWHETYLQDGQFDQHRMLASLK